MSTHIILASPEKKAKHVPGDLDVLADMHCSLSFSDLHELTGDERRQVPARKSGTPSTTEPMQFVDVLFEPLDMLEIRLIPSKHIIQQQRPLKYSSYRTRRQYAFWPWSFADKMATIVNFLAEMNKAAVTWWGEVDRTTRKLVHPVSIPGVPLNVYCSLNPRKKSQGRKDGDVLLARSLLADLENVTVDEALLRVQSASLPRPTMIVVSGHGVHLYWRLTEPVGNLAIWTRYQKRLIQALGSDPAIHDPARVIRLPGFMNVNHDPKPCYIHEADPGRRYTLADLDRVLPPSRLPASEPASPRRQISLVGEEVVSSPEPERAADLRRATAYADRFEPAEEHTRNCTLFARTCNLVEKFGINQDEALSLGRTINEKSDDPLDDAEVEEVVGKAVAIIDKKGGRKGTLQHKHVRVEKLQEPTGEIVPLKVWREQMQQARIDSLKEPGIYLDGSTTGAGKSFADLEAMKIAATSLTVLPTHDACNELVVELNNHGLKAAAHPPLDDNTCKEFGTTKRPGPAQRAQKAGLNVGESICPGCLYFKNCKYQKLREAARTADHTVATHARASHSDFHPAEGKPVVFVHEDPLNLFRPSVKVVRSSPKNDVPQARHLREVAQLAVQAEEIARMWTTPELIDFTQRLAGAASQLADTLESDSLLGPYLSALDAGNPTDGLATVEEIPVPLQHDDVSDSTTMLSDVTGWVDAITERKLNVDALLNEAMNKSGLTPNGLALKVAVKFVRGDLTHLCAVIDFGYKNERSSKALVGVWAVQPPENCVVWLENAHTQAGHLSRIVGRPVIDRTPKGRLDFKVPPIQYADHDVTQQTAGSTVRGLLRKIISSYGQARKVGVITHLCHIKELDKLDSLWSSRIVKKEYFHSGKDRASNAWLGCDLIVVLGTPRVPPVAIRDGLIRLGRLDAASQDGQFGMVCWEGKTVAGMVAHVHGSGYGEPSWAEMQHFLVREGLLQAVGRGRGVTQQGVPVVVVSNEPLGLTLADSPLDPLTDAQAEILQVVAELTAQIAIERDIANRAVTTAEVAHRTKYKPRHVRQLLSSLLTHGLLKRQGARGGWSIE